MCAQGSPSPPSILVPLQRLVPKISVLNRAPRPPTLANSGGPNPFKLCSLRRAWSLQTPDFLTRPQLLRLEISAESRSIRPSSSSSQTLLSSRYSTCTSANFTETPSLQRIHPNPQLRAPLYFSLLQFFLRIAFFFFLFCSFSPSYSLSSTSLTIYLVASFSSRSGPPKLTRHAPRSGDLKPLRALPLTFAQAISARRSPPGLAPPGKECFGQFSSEAPPPSSLLVFAPKSPASRASSPASLPRSPCFHSPCHTRQWQAQSGRSGKRAESERHGAPLFPPSDWVLDCSETPLYCGIAAPCLRRPDPQGRPLASASCRL